jgi:hypothetical protein
VGTPTPLRFVGLCWSFFIEQEQLRRLDTEARALFSSRESLNLRCGGSGICEHNRIRSTCNDCGPVLLQSARDPSATTTETGADEGHEEVAFIGLKRLKHRAIFRVRRHGEGVWMPWPTSVPLRAAALPVLDFLEALTATLVKKALVHAGLDPADAVLSRHCRPAARLANLAQGGIDSSPLDLFYYPNDHASCHVDNCTPHLDPGFLAIAVCSRDPGFRVWDVALQQWRSGAANPQGPCRQPLQDAIVFVGESLQNVTRGLYPACCHAVDRHSSPRLGIVYEMQPIGGQALEREVSTVVSSSSSSSCAVPVWTGGACVEGIEGLSVVRVSVFPCTCSRAQEQATEGRGAREKEMEGTREQEQETEVGRGCQIDCCLIEVLGGDEEEEEEEEQGGPRESSTVGAVGAEGAGGAEREDVRGSGARGRGRGGGGGLGYCLRVPRPRCQAQILKSQLPGTFYGKIYLGTDF